MVYVKEHEDNPIEGAKKWVKENQDLVESWMK
jgi:glycine betaine/proline transport system substrate-binding protein